MMVISETAKAVRHLAVILMTHRPASHLCIVHDDYRKLESDYIFGVDRMFELITDGYPALKPAYSHQGRELKLPNDSRCRFITLRGERDICVMQGLEFDFIAIGEGMDCTANMVRTIRMRNRSDLTMQDIKDMAI